MPAIETGEAVATGEVIATGEAVATGDHTDVSDHQLARRLAQEVGQELLGFRQGEGRPRSGLGANLSRPNLLRPNISLAAEGDLLAHNSLVKELATFRPDDAVLSEEGSQDLGRLDSRRLWIVDPLDGSKDYAYGSSEWAVHVGLCVDGSAVAGAVSLPAMDLVFATDGNLGDQAAPAADQRPAADQQTAPGQRTPKIVTARSRIHYEGMLLADALDAEVFACGSAGVKAMLVVHGAADAYVHASGLYEWDACAPAAVAQAAGLQVSDIHGRPLKFNQPDPIVPGFLVARPQLAESILEVLAASIPQPNR